MTPITSPKIKRLAQKAFKAPSMLTTAETRELGASVVAHVSPPKEVASLLTKKTAAKKVTSNTAIAKKASAEPS